MGNILKTKSIKNLVNAYKDQCMNKMEEKHTLLLLKSVPQLFSPNLIANIVSVSTILFKKAQPHGFLCVAKFYHLIVYTFMKDRFRSAVFLSSRNPSRNFVYFPSGKEKNSTWKCKHLTVLLGIRLNIGFHTDSCLCPTGLPVESC